MKFALKEDVALPAGAVYAAVADFGSFERAAARQGARVVRTRPDGPSGGPAWTVWFRYRRCERRIVLSVERTDPPGGLWLSGGSANIELAVEVRVLALSRDRSRLSLGIEVRPKTLSARFLIQSARLARGRIERRLAARLAAFARGCERGPLQR